MGLIEGLFETHLEVKNLEESMKFYEEKLGFKLGLYEEGRRRAFYLFGDHPISMISIVERESPNLRHIAFRVGINHLPNVIPFLKERNIEIIPGWQGASVEEPLVFPWLGSASVFFNDVDGNRLEFLTLLPEGPKKDCEQIYLSLSEWRDL